jgi:AAA domain
VPEYGWVGGGGDGHGEDQRKLRTRGVVLERVRPLRWIWSRRIPLGLPSLLVGEESVGKGTLAAWIIARATRGELDGDMRGKPATVLVVGDEDGFEPIWVPRLHLAGADLDRVRTVDDGEHVDDLAASMGALRQAVREDEIRLVVFDALLDHVPGGDNGAAVYNPKNVRQALMPLRRVAGEEEIAALGLLHPIKGRAASFRDLIAGSHQFNAVSRSSLLLGVDPDADDRRVLVRGKGNHTAAPRSVEFTIVGEAFELNGHTFEMPKAANVREGNRTVATS